MSSEAPISSEAPVSSEAPISSEAPLSSEAGSSEETIDHIQVFCPTNYTKIWAWVGSTNLFKAWPGEDLLSYDANWKTYDFPGYTALSVIFSEGGQNQTRDLSISKAGYWYFLDGNWYNQDPLDPDFSIPEIEPTDPSTDKVTRVTNAPTYRDLPFIKTLPASIAGENLYSGSRTDFRDESIYFAITTRFYDGDASNNAYRWGNKNRVESDPDWRGDFKGLIEKMDYIKALGFTAIWITPIVKNASGLDYHGYHAINFQEVDPRYESEDVRFADVIKEAHKRDMKIVLDVVFNHTGNFGEENLFPMFERSRTDSTIAGMKRKNEALLPDYYETLNDGDQFQARVKSMKDVSKDGGHDDTYIYHHEKNMGYETYIEQTGSMAGDCIDLNTENPTVINYLVESYCQFIRMGVDAFRIDTMKHISRLVFNNYLWPAFHDYAKRCGNNSFHMFGECCTRVREVWNHNIPADSCPFYSWKESKNYAWGTREQNEASVKQNWDDNNNPEGQPTSGNAHLNGMSYHTPDHSRWSGNSTIDFPMHWNFDSAYDAYNVAVGNDHFYNDATYNVVYVDSHDYAPDSGQDFRFKGDQATWKENMSLMFTFRGVPCIFYGSEIEFQKGKKIDDGENTPLSETGRAYYGANLEGTVTATGFGNYTATGTVKNTLSHNLAKHLQMLNKIRLQVPALRRGQYKSFGDLKFVRRYTAGGIDSVAAVAISGGCTFTGLPNGTYRDLVSGNTKNVSGGTLSVDVSGKGNLAVYVKQ